MNDLFLWFGIICAFYVVILLINFGLTAVFSGYGYLSDNTIQKNFDKYPTKMIPNEYENNGKKHHGQIHTCTQKDSSKKGSIHKESNKKISNQNKAMKHLYTLFTLLFIMSCTPQKRLTRLLERYPQLITDSTYTLPVQTTLPYLTATYAINITAPEPLRQQLLAELTTGTSVTAGVARASLQATDSGLILMAEQLPDTIPDSVSITLPSITVTAKQPPEKPINSFFRILGIIANTLFVLIRPLREFSVGVSVFGMDVTLRTLDLVGVFVLLLLLVIYFATIITDARYYAKIDPRKD